MLAAGQQEESRWAATGRQRHQMLDRAAVLVSILYSICFNRHGSGAAAGKRQHQTPDRAAVPLSVLSSPGTRAVKRRLSWAPRYGSGAGVELRCFGRSRHGREAAAARR